MIRTACVQVARGAGQLAERNAVSKVEARYAGFLAQQAQRGASFTQQQRRWLDCVAEAIATSAGVTPEDLDNAPFTERGGGGGAIRDLGTEAAHYIEQFKLELTT